MPGCKLTALAALGLALCATTPAPAFSPNSPKPAVRPTIVRPQLRPRIYIPSIGRRLVKKSVGSGKHNDEASKKSIAAQKEDARRRQRLGQATARQPRTVSAMAQPPLPQARPQGAPGDEGLGGQDDRIAALARMRELVTDLMLAGEAARLGDMKDAMDANAAVDRDGLGGGASHDPRQRAKAMTAHLPQESSSGPHEPWKPQGAGQPGNDRTGSQNPGLARTPHGKRDSSNLPGFSTRGRPGRFDAGLPGQGGETRNGGHSCGSNCWVETYKWDGHSSRTVMTWAPDNGSADDGDLSNGATGSGTMTSTTTYTWSDGSTDEYTTTGSVDEKGNYTLLGDVHTGHTGPPGEPAHDMEFSESDPAADPDSQPNPEEAPSGEHLGCPGGCWTPPATVPWQNQVSQPGGSGADGDRQGDGGFKASTAERTDVVTNPSPVDDSYRARTSGGSRYSREEALREVMTPGTPPEP